ncbi:hypothetical protein V0R50_23225 [Pseudomonas sp. 148P]|uniref:Uncharacterized protein n=1 Tax=Pseudomonas ulcerans TaxID=3115852 RepID=A0ABU7HX52_9PSED|nr:MULTISPECIES: hypothetical protein [unclassified Pseudomonas]MEE1924738.1 hypothetical protein [Pseudomonas sp. 147P]MEE1936147.1 hypothetical protein [Pseudomonas sp. 148P]
MHRDQYLGNTLSATTSHVVRDFVDWLARNLGNTTLFTHQYTDRRSGIHWKFQGLQDACARYQWRHKGAPGVAPGADLGSNGQALDALARRLRSSLDPVNDQAAFSAAADVMTWGGVQAGNIRWLSINTKDLAQTLTTTAAALARGDLAGQILTSNALRFNAGMTKVYSLLVDDFIIYDSRVAAALGWIVVKYCKEKQLSSVPAELAFPWAPSKEGPRAKSPKNRNPGQKGLSFPRLSAGAVHAEWNLKASWILAAALARAPAGGFAASSGVSALRQLEAALFMIGYDLPRDGSNAEAPTPDDSWTECYTAARNNRFHYLIDDDAIRLHGGRRYPIEIINKMLNILWEVSRSTPFPLANSATKVRAGESAFGIGTAYFEATDRKGNPPDASALAAVLQDIGALRFTPGRRDAWSINTDAFPGEGMIDVTALVTREIELREDL